MNIFQHWNYERTKHLAVICLIGALIFSCVEIGLTFGSLRRQLNASADYNESIKGSLQGVNDVVGEVRELVADGRPAIQRLKDVEDQIIPVANNLAALESHLDREVAATMQTARTQVGTIAPVMEELRRFTADTNYRVNSKDGLIATVTASASELTAAASKAGLAIETLSADGSALVRATTRDVDALLTSGQTLIMDLDGTVKATKPVVDNLAGVTEDFHGVTTDGRNYLHSLLFPPPVHGFWPNVWRVFKFVITPAYDLGRLYYVLRPVK